jgi:hypothetical protein
MAEMMVAFLCFFRHHPLHLGAVITVERVTFYEGGIDTFAIKNTFERLLDRSGAGAG